MKHPWLLAPALLLVLCASIWMWAENVPKLAHASSPNDPPWLQAQMQRQRLATKIGPLAQLATYWAGLLTVVGFVAARKYGRVTREE